MLSQRTPKLALRFATRLLRGKCNRSLRVPRIRLSGKCEETFSWNSKGADFPESFVECVEGFRIRINDEFASLAQSFRITAGQQSDGMRTYTQALLAILEDSCASAISRQQAGYCLKRLMGVS